MNSEDAGLLLQEMRDVKMLLILQHLNSGVKQKQIALMLGISEASMSRMMPKGLSMGKGKNDKGAQLQES